MQREKATLNINPELHKELKIEAAKREMKIGDLAEKFLKEALRKHD